MRISVCICMVKLVGWVDVDVIAWVGPVKTRVFQKLWLIPKGNTEKLWRKAGGPLQSWREYFMFRSLSNEFCNGNQEAKHWRQVNREKLLCLVVSGERVNVGGMKNASRVGNEGKWDLVWADE